MRTLVWGAGAIGATIGAFLARAGHDVTLVDVVDDTSVYVHYCLQPREQAAEQRRHVPDR